MTLTPGISASQITRYLGGHSAQPVEIEVLLDWQVKTSPGTYNETIDLGAEDPGRYYVLQILRYHTGGTGTVTEGTTTFDGVVLNNAYSIPAPNASRSWERVLVHHKPTGTGTVTVSFSTTQRVAYRIFKVTNAVLRNWRAAYTSNTTMTAALGPIAMPTQANYKLLATMYSGQDGANMFDPSLTLFGNTQDIASVSGSSNQRLQAAVEEFSSAGTVSVGSAATAAAVGKALDALMFESYSEEDTSKIGVEPVILGYGFASAPSTTAQTVEFDLGEEDPGRYYVVAVLNGRGPLGGAANRSAFALDGDVMQASRLPFQTTDRGQVELHWVHKPTGTGRGTLSMTRYSTDTAGGVPQMAAFKVTRAKVRGLKQTAVVADTTGNPLVVSGMNSDSLTLGHGVISNDTSYDLTDRSLWNSTDVLGDILQVTASGLPARSEMTYIYGATATVEQKASASSLIKANLALSFDKYDPLDPPYIPEKYVTGFSGSSGTLSAMSFAGVLCGRGIWWEAVTNPTHLTVPDTGLVRVAATMYRTSAYTMSTTKNGSEYFGNFHANKADTSSGYGTNAVSAITPMTAGDYLEIATQGFNSTYTHWATAEIMDPATKYAFLGKTGTQSFAANTWTAISWDNEIVDTDNFHGSSNPTRLVVPSGVTKVRITAQVEDDNTATSSTSQFQAVRVTKNGGTSGHGLGYTRETRYTGVQIRHLSTAIIDVTPGDYFEIEINSTWAGNVVTGNSWVQIEAIPSDTRYALVDLSSNWSITANGAISWGNTVHDPEGLFNGTSGLVVPAGVTSFRFSYGAYITSNGNTTAAALRENGTTAWNSPRQNRYARNVAGLTAFGCWTSGNVGDVWDMILNTTNGSALNANAYSWLMMEIR